MTTPKHNSQDGTSKRNVNRREFIAGAGAALSFTMMKPDLVRGSAANSKIALGLVGCGGRGSWIADLFMKHGGYQVVAGADYFQDRVDEFGAKFNVPAERRHTGLACYRKLLAGKVDAVAIESPPYFHPAQAAAAVDAGVHVYLAKPVAVDVPGCQDIEESGKKATEKKLCYLVDFQTRTDPFYQEAVKRVQAGQIGRIVCGEATYIAGDPFTRYASQLLADPENAEWQLRAWGLSRALSGDIITEQNIHALDVMSWVLDQAPRRAYGTGGRKARQAGDCWDHFSVIFTFPNDLVVTFCSKQYGAGWDDILCRMYGTEGTVDTHYSGEVSILGKNPYAGGKAENMYANGAIRNIATFYDSVTKGDCSNPTVAPSVRSNMTTILGRTAAYRHAEVTWEEVARSRERLQANLKGLKA
jgi:myo-inositol 2-dehydrogenase/D-chiro-inositol 1-dehydrogenase